MKWRNIKEAENGSNDGDIVYFDHEYMFTDHKPDRPISSYQNIDGKLFPTRVVFMWNGKKLRKKDGSIVLYSKSSPKLPDETEEEKNIRKGNKRRKRKKKKG